MEAMRTEEGQPPVVTGHLSYEQSASAIQMPQLETTSDIGTLVHKPVRCQGYL